MLNHLIHPQHQAGNTLMPFMNATGTQVNVLPKTIGSWKIQLLTSCLAQWAERVYDVLICKRLSSRCVCIYTTLHCQALLSRWGSAALPDCAQRRLPAIFKPSWKFLPCKKQDLPEEHWRISALKLCINCLFLTIIFLHSVLHCNDSCIQYYLWFFCFFVFL